MIVLSPIQTLDAIVAVPGSKSLTQRALIAAALAEGESELVGPLASEDTRFTIEALRAMGIACDDQDSDRWRIEGSGGRIVPPSGDIFLGNNGTATRFLTSVAALGQGTFHITGDARMAERPIDPLMQALRGWGVRINSDRGTGCPPLTIQADGLAGGMTVLPESQSSQYLSSLLLVAPYARNLAELESRGPLLSRPYVEMTLAVMADFGIRVAVTPRFDRFRIPQGCYQGRVYAIEGDASSASYFWAAAAVTGGRVIVRNVPVPSLQGDAMLLPYLGRMGCWIQQTDAGIQISGPERLQGIELDMGDMPDVAPTLAVVAAFAEGTTTINNIAHLRIKECDRITAVVTELRKLGVEVEEEPSRMIIHGRGGSDLHGATIATYNDHRIAMSFAVAGLRIPGVIISKPECVAKSFPDFWTVFRQLS
ncbi:MAG: 3-phosphoshikimate 1-carboxyvinyltransferase [Desulfobulbus sp.]|jgi:3-phosphoshikimate 1-carboxyvinyltransferase